MAIHNLNENMLLQKIGYKRKVDLVTTKSCFGLVEGSVSSTCTPTTSPTVFLSALRMRERDASRSCARGCLKKTYNYQSYNQNATIFSI